MNKFICWLFGHDYEIYRTILLATLEEVAVKRICKRCGKEDRA